MSPDSLHRFHLDPDELREWKRQHAGQYECPYCGSVTYELRVCCGELHGQKIHYTPERKTSK